MRWVLCLAWVAMPFAAGPALAGALHHHHHLRTGASIALWAAWATGVLATLVAHPVSLTVIRSLAPAAIAALVAAAADGGASIGAVAGGLAVSLLATGLAFLPDTALVCVNGPAYPNERRFPLAVPGALLLGPLPVAWAILVGLPSAATLLLFDRHWVVGGVLAAVAIPATALIGRALHTLSRRWIVFVPAGLVLHDPLSLEDPVLFQRKAIERLGPALQGTDSLDLTQRAAGLTLELVLTEKVPMVLMRPGRRRVEGASARLLFTPSRPGAVLAAARERKLPVG